MLSRAPLFVVFFSSLSLIVLSASGCGGAEARIGKHLEKGRSFLAAENWDKARIEFQNVLQIAPRDIAARIGMGTVDEKLGNSREAVQFYRGVIDLDPDNVEARAKLGRLFLFSAAPSQAIEMVEPGIQKHPDDAALLTVRAASRSQLNDRPGARADAERAVELAPANEDSVSVLAGIYKSDGDSAKAQALLEQTILTNPNTVELRLILAQIYAEESRPTDVEAQLIKVIQLKPAEKAHRLRLAQFYAKSNQLDAAEQTLRKAVQELPERDVKLSLIDFLATRRSRVAAEKELKGFVDAAPADNEMKFALAQFYVEGKNLPMAEAIYLAVIDKEKFEPAGLTARNRLAVLRWQDNDVKGALDLTSKVLAKSPRDDDALTLRGSISLAKQDPRAAITDLRAVLRNQPNAVGVIRSLAQAHFANGEPAIAEETMRHAVEANPRNAALQLSFAQLLIEVGKPDQARPILAELVKQQPGDVAALDAQFRLSIVAHDLHTAQSAAESMVTAQPKVAKGYFYEGVLAEEDKRADDALRLYAQAVSIQPDELEPLQAQIRLLVGLKRVDEAYKRADAMSARYPNNPLGPEAKAELLVSHGRNTEAQVAFNEAIARAPKWWPPYRGLAAIQTVEKNPDGAIEILKKAQSIVEQPDKIEMELASILESAAKPDEAISEYEVLLRQNPQSELVMNNLAMLLATYKKDRPSLDRAKDLTARFADSGNPSFMDTYGWVLYKRGEMTASVPVLERVVAKMPNEPVPLYHLGMAQSQLGSNSEARDNLTHAINSGANFPGLKEAKATLDKIARTPELGAIAPKS